MSIEVFYKVLGYTRHYVTQDIRSGHETIVFNNSKVGRSYN